LKPCLLFLHLYFALTAITACIFAAVTGTDPLRAFAVHDGSVYLVAQAGFAFAFSLYSVFLCTAMSCSRLGTSELCMRMAQIAASVFLGGVYYVVVWTPAMLDKLPELTKAWSNVVGEGSEDSLAWVPYLVPSVVFLCTLRLEQLAWRSRGKSDKDASPSIAFREDGELRVGMTELASLVGHQDLEAQQKRSS